jgi:4-diphosphocytidyl-2-C-methyl-D-erythritol kinase
MVKLGIQDGDLRRLGAALGNDLEAVVAAEYPVIEEIHSFLESRGCAGAAMTGSGSGVFGVMRTLDQAEAVREELSGKGWTAFLVHPCATGNRRLERAADVKGGPA